VVQRTRLVPTEVAHHEIPRDRREPPEGIVWNAVLAPLPQGTEPRFLRDVLSQLAPAAASTGHVAVQLHDGVVVVPFQLGFGNAIGHPLGGVTYIRRTKVGKPTRTGPERTTLHLGNCCDPVVAAAES